VGEKYWNRSFISGHTGNLGEAEHKEIKLKRKERKPICVEFKMFFF
jgi:hypothetical protein